MKLAYLFFLAVLFASCKKSSSDQTTTTTTTGTSNKIKRITDSQQGSKQAYIQEFEYDANGRLKNYLYRDEDSNFTPVKIIDQSKTVFSYSGSADKPLSDSAINYFSNNSNFINYYTYDSQDKLLKTERSNYNGNTAKQRVVYNYGTNTMIRNLYTEQPTGSGVFVLQSVDTCFLDVQNRVTELRHYRALPPSTYLSEKQFFAYDANANPLDLVNTNKYLKYYYEYEYFNMTGLTSVNGIVSTGLASNNLISYKRQPGIMATSTEKLTYTYNSAGLPIDCTEIYVPDIANPTASTTEIVKFEYY